MTAEIKYGENCTSRARAQQSKVTYKITRGRELKVVFFRSERVKFYIILHIVYLSVSRFQIYGEHT